MAKCSTRVSYTTPGRYGGGGAGTTWLVGSAAEVAAALARYADLGIRHFVLSDTPYRSEVARVGDQLLPLLRNPAPLAYRATQNRGSPMATTLTRPVVVYGVGAIGGVIAARLRLAGFEVTAVARGAHLEAIRAGGLTLVTQAGADAVDLSVAAHAGQVDWSDDPGGDSGRQEPPDRCGPGGSQRPRARGHRVFVAQNGVANEAAVLRRFAHVYGITVMLPAAHLEPGVVVQQSYPVAGILDLGAYPRGHDQQADLVAATLRAAGFHSRVRDDVMAWKHRKLIANLGNGVAAVYCPGPQADELVARAHVTRPNRSSQRPGSLS